MKSVVITLIVVLFVSCSREDSSPTSPVVPPPTARATDVAVWVRSASGACLAGAVVEVLDGARKGARGVQADCGAIYDGGGIYFSVPTGISVQLRATKDGYASQVATVEPRTTDTISYDFALTPQ